MESKINTWLKYLWEIKKDEENEGQDAKIIEEIRYFLFQIRKETKRNYDLIKEGNNEQEK